MRKKENEDYKYKDENGDFTFMFSVRILTEGWVTIKAKTLDAAMCDFVKQTYKNPHKVIESDRSFMTDVDAIHIDGVGCRWSPNDDIPEGGMMYDKGCNNIIRSDGMWIETENFDDLIDQEGDDKYDE